MRRAGPWLVATVGQARGEPARCTTLLRSGGAVLWPDRALT
ncbi:hypothetical protein [Modestobacter marinus]|nr:hypothetical protein [Modestobacter marinus]